MVCSVQRKAPVIPFMYSIALCRCQQFLSRLSNHILAVHMIFFTSNSTAQESIAQHNTTRLNTSPCITTAHTIWTTQHNTSEYSIRQFYCLSAESEVCAGNIKLGPCCVFRTFEVSIILLYIKHCFPKTRIPPCKWKFYTAHIRFCARMRGSLTIIRNTRSHYGKSKPLKNQSECVKYLCNVICTM